MIQKEKRSGNFIYLTKVLFLILIIAGCDSSSKNGGTEIRLLSDHSPPVVTLAAYAEHFIVKSSFSINAAI